MCSGHYDPWCRDTDAHTENDLQITIGAKSHGAFHARYRILDRIPHEDIRKHTGVCEVGRLVMELKRTGHMDEMTTGGVGISLRDDQKLVKGCGRPL